MSGWDTVTVTVPPAKTHLHQPEMIKVAAQRYKVYKGSVTGHKQTWLLPRNPQSASTVTPKPPLSFPKADRGFFWDLNLSSWPKRCWDAEGTRFCMLWRESLSNTDTVGIEPGFISELIIWSYSVCTVRNAECCRKYHTACPVLFTLRLPAVFLCLCVCVCSSFMCVPLWRRRSAHT